MATNRAGEFRMRAGACATVGAAALLVFAGCGRREAAREGSAATAAETRQAPTNASRTATPAPPPIALPAFRATLDWTAGPAGTPAALTVRLVAPPPVVSARSGRPISAPPGAALDAPKDWLNAIAFERRDPGAKDFTPWTNGVQVAVSPGATRLTFVSHALIRLVFRIAPDAVPPPGTDLRAFVRLGPERIRSETFVVPIPPADAVAAEGGAAAAAIACNDWTAAAAAAERIIARDPARHEGYWYRGLAAEGAGDRAAARSALREALARYPEPAPGRWVEPPARLLRKLDALDAR